MTLPAGAKPSVNRNQSNIPGVGACRHKLRDANPGEGPIPRRGFRCRPLGQRRLNPCRYASASRSCDRRDLSAPLRHRDRRGVTSSRSPLPVVPLLCPGARRDAPGPPRPSPSCISWPGEKPDAPGPPSLLSPLPLGDFISWPGDTLDAPPPELPPMPPPRLCASAIAVVAINRPAAAAIDNSLLLIRPPGLIEGPRARFQTCWTVPIGNNVSVRVLFPAPQRRRTLM